MGKVVVHLIVGLDKAGAETMLYQILKNSHCNNIYKVVSMGKGNYYKPYIENLGIEVLELNMKQHPFKSIGAAKKILKGADTLCCWMYHSNLVGYLAAKHLGIKKIIWCIRHSDLSPAHNKRRTLFINNICARFSRNVSLILYNGKRARKVHEAVGYCKERGVITDNGCDTNEYKFDPEARTCLLKELNIQPDKKILLSVTRDAPIKDVPTFLEAFVRVHKKENDTIAVLCGSGITVENEKITEFCEKKGIIIEKDIFSMWFKVVVACIPGAVVTILFDDFIEAHLHTPIVIAITLIVYGIAFIVIERWNKTRTPKVLTLNDITYKTAFIIGLFQILSIIPGTSRSGSTIIGALLIGVSRVAAAEFTFFLAVPVMFGLSFLKIIKFGLAFSATELTVLVIGTVVAFLVSILVIKFLMGYIKKHDFLIFGWYRIVLGILVMLYFSFV